MEPEEIPLPEVPPEPKSLRQRIGTLKIPMHPELKSRMSESLEKAFEAKYMKEQEEARRAEARR